MITGYRVDASTVSLTSLHAACRAGRRDAFETLLSHYGLDVTGRDGDGWTALHTAVLHSDVALCRRLLALGAQDVAANDGVHASALHRETWSRASSEAAGPDPTSWEPPDSAVAAVDQLVSLIANSHRISTEELCCRVSAAVERVGVDVLEEIGSAALWIRGWPGRWTLLTAAVASGRVSLCWVCLERGANANKGNAAGCSPLYGACTVGLPDCARLLVDWGADVGEVRKEGETLLRVACLKQHPDCVRFLLDCGAEVDKANACGETALHLAARVHSPGCIRVLLGRGAQVDHTSNSGCTPLQSACLAGNIRSARLLLRHGADVNRGDSCGHTPLHYACRVKRSGIAALLLEYGADPAKRNGNGDTAADSARSESGYGVFQPDNTLAEAIELALTDPTAAIRQLWATHMRARHSMVVFVEIFTGGTRRTISVGVDTTTSIRALQGKLASSTGMHCMEYRLAHEGKHISGSGLLSDHNIGDEATLSMTIPGGGGMSATHQSATAENATDSAFADACTLRRCMHRMHHFSPGIVGHDLLHDAARSIALGHWSLIAGRHVDGSTLSPSSLHVACRTDQLKAVDSLVRYYGLDVNGRDVWGWTPLHIAMLHGNEDVVRGLLSLGADDVPTEDGVHASCLRPDLWVVVAGDTAREVTARPQRPSVWSAFASLFAQKSGSLPWCGPWEVPQDAQAAVTQLVEMMKQGNVSTEVLCRRVCAAVEALGTAVLQEEEPERHDIDRSNSSDWERFSPWTLLAAATLTGRFSLCRLCIELGAEVNQRAPRDGPPLYLACQRNFHECAHLLLEHGADVNTTGVLWISCLNEASSRGHIDCVRLLLDHGADPECADRDCMAPLGIACARGHMDCARLLLERGAAPNPTSTPPVTLAFIGGSRHAAAILLEHGADVSEFSARVLEDDPESRFVDPEFAQALRLATRDRQAAIDRLWELDAEGPQEREVSFFERVRQASVETQEPESATVCPEVVRNAERRMKERCTWPLATARLRLETLRKRVER